MGQLIRLYLADETLDGLRTLELSNTTIKATVFPRALLKDFLSRPEANKPGVYLLYGYTENGDPNLYIGEGDPVCNRLEDHNRRKDFWTEAYVFTSKDDYLTKTQIQLLESLLIAKAKETQRIELDNSQMPAEPSISEVERSEAETFLSLIMTLTTAMKLPFFTPLAQDPKSTGAHEKIYEYSTKNCHAKMAIRDGKYVVLAGSTASTENTSSASPGICSLRKALIQQGILVNTGENTLRAEKDIPVNSPSYAAALIYGGNINGWKAWKYHGKTLSQLERSESGSNNS